MHGNQCEFGRGDGMARSGTDGRSGFDEHPPHQPKTGVSSHTARRLMLSSDMHALAKCMRSIESECGNSLGQAYPAGPLIVRHCCVHSIVSPLLPANRNIIRTSQNCLDPALPIPASTTIPTWLETTAVFCNTHLPAAVAAGGRWELAT